MKTPIALTLVICLCGFGVVNAASDGWLEITPSGYTASVNNATSTSRSATKTGNEGDKLWFTRAGDTLESIALGTTGSLGSVQAIADYNALDVFAQLPMEKMLFIPADLLLPPNQGQQAPNWEIQEFDDDIEGGSTIVQERPLVQAIPEPMDYQVGESVRMDKSAGDPGLHAINKKVDMFAGEVRVLGVVDVNRVAVGNGGIVRAEVLKSGELLVIAQTPGSSSLHLWHKDQTQTNFNIRVSETDPETRVRMERMVRMKVRMVEFRKSALGSLGINWGDSAAGPTLATAGDLIGNNLYRPASEGFAQALPNTVKPFSTYFGIASNITSRINFLASRGDAVTLAEPVLTSTNGGTANFLAGGEVPYPSVGSNGQTTVEFKEYGIKLNVSPKIDSAGNVRTHVETEISQIDPAVSVQGTPGLLTRRAQTQVNVRSGETIVISGLLSSEQSKDVDSIPGIGRLPVIGALFRSQNTRKSVTELVIFVTPEVVEPQGQLLNTREQQFYENSLDQLNSARSALPILE